MDKRGASYTVGMSLAISSGCLSFCEVDIPKSGRLYSDNTYSAVSHEGTFQHSVAVTVRGRGTKIVTFVPNKKSSN